MAKLAVQDSNVLQINIMLICYDSGFSLTQNQPKLCLKLCYITDQI